MSRNEDYLDNLLTSVTNRLDEFDDDYEQSRESLKESYRTQRDLPPETQHALDEIREDNFLRDFEADMGLDASEEDFIRDFEKELEDEPSFQMDTPAKEDMSLDDILNAAQDAPDIADMAGAAEPQSAPQTPEPEPMLQTPEPEPQPQAFEPKPLPDEDTIVPDDMDFADLGLADMTDFQMPQDTPDIPDAPQGMEGLADLFSQEPEQKPEPEPQMDGPLLQTENLADDNLDMSLEQIMGDSEADDKALADIGRMLDAEDNDAQPVKEDDPFAMAPEFVGIEPEDVTEPEKKEKNPNSLFARIARLLFGTPQELDPDAAPSDEEINATADLDAKQAEEEKKQQKALKKQQKKEAAELKKQEKAAAKAEKEAAKAAKPKKEKKPKEKKKAPKEPPLPRVPVMMMWTIALSMLVLILLGTSLVGYSAGVGQAKESFAAGDYVTAYERLQGVKIKKADEDLYHGTVALAGIQTELDSYTALMEQKQYELALDALIRGIGRCEVHSAEAEEWGVSGELRSLEKQLNKLLREQFDVSKRRAKKLYRLKKRREYTLEVHKILEELGLYQSTGV